MNEAVDMHPERTLIPARTGWSKRLQEGERFAVVDLEGGQAADLWVFSAADPEEYLSAPHTRVHMGRIYPETGWTFVTNERRPILEFVEDTSPGAHDCLVAACDPARYRLLGGGRRVTPPARRTSCPSCPSMDIEIGHAPQPINVFANFRVTRRRGAGPRRMRVASGRRRHVPDADGGRGGPLRLPSGHRRLPAWRPDGHGG